MPLGPWHWKVLSIVGDYDNKTATAPVQQQVEGDGIGKNKENESALQIFW